MRDLTGIVLGNYKLLKQIGEGTFGEVYLAQNVYSTNILAVKLFSAYDQNTLKEAEMLSRLKHDNIVRVYDFGKAGEQYYMSMELCTCSLRDILNKKGSLGADQAIHVTLDVLSGLQYAHDQNICVLHRDIKPENVLFDSKGNAKLCDFGLFKNLKKSAISSAIKNPNVPIERVIEQFLHNSVGNSAKSSKKIVGTMYYMSPEQREMPGSVDQRSDLFSVGTVLYETLAGHLPDATYESVGRKDIDDIILKSRQRDPARRFQSAAEMKHALEALVGGIYTPKEPEETRKYDWDSDKGLPVEKPVILSRSRRYVAPQTLYKMSKLKQFILGALFIAVALPAALFLPPLFINATIDSASRSYENAKSETSSARQAYAKTIARTPELEVIILANESLQKAVDIEILVVQKKRDSLKKEYESERKSETGSGRKENDLRSQILDIGSDLKELEGEKEALTVTKDLWERKKTDEDYKSKMSSRPYGPAQAKQENASQAYAQAQGKNATEELIRALDDAIQKTGQEERDAAEATTKQIQENYAKERVQFEKKTAAEQEFYKKEWESRKLGAQNNQPQTVSEHFRNQQREGGSPQSVSEHFRNQQKEQSESRDYSGSQTDSQPDSGANQGGSGNPLGGLFVLILGCLGIYGLYELMKKKKF